MIPPSIVSAGRELRAGAYTSVELTEALLARADRLDHLIDVYACRFDESALDSAQRADRELRAGIDRGPLHGIPIGVKDVISTSEGPTRAGSNVGRVLGHGPAADAVVVTALRSSGAVVIGKTRTYEFALGTPGPSRPRTRNPWNPAHDTGGSSSGSAAGVAAGFFLGALGTDTAGSVRVPAAWCGVTGLCPSRHRLPRDGVLTLSRSLDRVGLLTRTADDAAAMLDSLAGSTPAKPARAPRPIAGTRIGVERAHHLRQNPNQPDVTERFEEAVKTFDALGAVTTNVELPHVESITAATMATMLVEGLNEHRDRLRTQWDLFGEATRCLLAAGAMLGSADYLQAQRVRAEGRRLVGTVFDDVDAVVHPTVGTSAPMLDNREHDDGLSVIYTMYWSALGNPALSIPMGRDASGLPIGLQIATRRSDDQLLLRLASAFQGLTRWHLSAPFDEGASS